MVVRHPGEQATYDWLMTGERPDGVTAWRKEHLEHTSGYETIITTERGASVYASHPATERHKVGK